MVATIHRLTDFETTINKGLYKVDRTPYIEKYEKANDSFVICLRPKGFDKQLLLSTLFYFYSKKLSKTSRKLFQKLYISRFEPISKSSFLILYLDLSSIEPDDPGSLRDDYATSIEHAIQEYCHFESVGMPLRSETAPIQLLREFLNFYGHDKLFVLVNEYDGFHYEILDPEPNHFKSMKFGKNPVIAGLYVELKQAIHSKKLGRVFVVGTDESQDR